ncbi:hypothetical protein [Spirulina major]|uniref:hypothetical protein n=1 Tax=Spirulina major TaxID=270636 RepID=UPI0009343AEB|nr:hypothetical protein [Spirulina major]
MRKLVFSDTETFYRELKIALEQGEQVEVVTDYKRYSDLPEKLKTIFELHKNKSGEWIHVATGAFIPLSTSVTTINYSVLFILGGAGMGALVGAIVGGLVGAAVGGGIGAIVGTVAVATSSGKHHVEIEIDASGKLRLKITPIR